ncbi:MAG: hypothetical protein P1U56_25840 [Saprospiraceae bacterium]|nr:hypothetical protein [Saprospiraceae bacterium]
MNKDIENILGFNQGYELAKADNDLALSTINDINENSSEKLQFFKEGVIEYEKEKLYEQLKSKDQDLDKEIEKE